MSAARYLDARMQESQRAGKTVGIERGAVMVALNMAHELLRMREQSAVATSEWGRRVKVLYERVDSVLQEEFKEPSLS